MHHRKSIDTALPHRGRLSARMYTSGGALVPASSAGAVEDDVERLRVVNRELQALMQEQMQLSASIAARLGSTAGQHAVQPQHGVQPQQHALAGGPALPALPAAGSHLAAGAGKHAPLAPLA